MSSRKSRGSGKCEGKRYSVDSPSPLRRIIRGTAEKTCGFMNMPIDFLISVSNGMREGSPLIGSRAQAHPHNLAHDLASDKKCMPGKSDSP